MLIIRIYEIKNQKKLLKKKKTSDDLAIRSIEVSHLENHSTRESENHQSNTINQASFEANYVSPCPNKNGERKKLDTTEKNNKKQHTFDENQGSKP